MARREFLQFLSGTTATLLAGCAAQRPVMSTPPAPRARIRAICFDVFTLFDPRSVVRAAETAIPSGAAELCAALRVRQFEYSWMLTAADQYLDFHAVTTQALLYAEKDRRLSLSTEQRQTIVDAYSQLDVWPDTHQRLLEWKRSGLRLAPLSNYPPVMLERLIDHAKLTGVFDMLISTDRAKTFKPNPRAYALGPALLGLEKREIAFAAFGGWDALGAKWFGFPTFWVNRLGVTEETLPPGPDATGPTFAELAAFVAG